MRLHKNMTRADAMAIADWHMSKSDGWGDRHDRIAFRIFKLIHAGFYD